MQDGELCKRFLEIILAVETAKKDPRLMVEYMSYYAEQATEQLVIQCGMSEEEALAAVKKYW